MPFFRIILASIALLAGPALWADQTTTFVVDPEHSQVRFQWNHLGFSSPSAHFEVVEGEITVNETRLDRSSVSISIATSSLNTHVPALNEHLLSNSDFFQPEQFPTITYISTGISNLDLEEKSFDLDGILSINGIEQPITLTTQVNKVGAHPMWDDAQAIGVDAETELLRSAFNMDAHAPYVSDALQVNITLEAIEKEAYLAKLPTPADEEEQTNGTLSEKLDKHLLRDAPPAEEETHDAASQEEESTTEQNTPTSAGGESEPTGNDDATSTEAEQDNEPDETEMAPVTEPQAA